MPDAQTVRPTMSADDVLDMFESVLSAQALFASALVLILDGRKIDKKALAADITTIATGLMALRDEWFPADAESPPIDPV